MYFSSPFSSSAEILMMVEEDVEVVGCWFAKIVLFLLAKIQFDWEVRNSLVNK